MGVVGVGRMGLPIVSHLVGAGVPVVAGDRDAACAAAVRARGGTWSRRLDDLAAGVEVLITVLPGPQECRQVMLDQGVLDAMRSGATWIDMTSNDPVVVAPVRARAGECGVHVIEAPMGGGPAEARAGTLQLFIGGSVEDEERHRRLLEAVADPDQIIHMGGPDAGYITKLLVNLLWFGQAVATTEALLLADRVGLDLRTLLAALDRSAAHTRYLDTGARAHLDGDLMTSFGLERICAELAAVTALAGVHDVPFEMSRLVRSVHERALGRYGQAYGELLGCRYLEDLAATRLDER